MLPSAGVASLISVIIIPLSISPRRYSKVPPDTGISYSYVFPFFWLLLGGSEVFPSLRLLLLSFQAAACSILVVAAFSAVVNYGSGKLVAPPGIHSLVLPSASVANFSFVVKWSTSTPPKRHSRVPPDASVSCPYVFHLLDSRVLLRGNRAVSSGASVS